jgi:hypothetical protein
VAALLILRRNLLTVKKSALVLLILIAALVPWTLYQKLYDPPGDRLLKIHLAGIIPPDPRSTWQAVWDSYGHLGLQSAVKHKWANVETLLGQEPFAWRGVDARVAQREYVWNALGILNVGWIVGCVQWARRKRRARFPHAGAMIGAAVLNLIVWCIVLFGPGQAFNESGSYGNILLLATGLAGCVLALPSVALIALLALQAINLVTVWVMFQPGSFTLPSRVTVAPAMQWPMLALAVCLGGGLFWHFAMRYLGTHSTPALADAFFQKKPQ